MSVPIHTVTAMWCLGCGAIPIDPVCPRCLVRMRPAPGRWIGGVLIRSAFLHEGPARSIVHSIKYRSVPVGGVGRFLTSLLPPDATALVPVPRAPLRQWRFGVDPALELARSLAADSGIPVFEALEPPAWVLHRAGPSGRLRGRPRFRRRREVPEAAVLVDDVVTTGATLAAAAAVTGLTSAVTLTAAVR